MYYVSDMCAHTHWQELSVEEEGLTFELTTP
jgi:hypothetical protein